MRRKYLRGVSTVIAISLLTSGCALLPTEEEFPIAPTVNTYQAQEYRLTQVQRGDLTLAESVICQYVPTNKENLQFSIGGEYVAGVYVSEGEHVKAGDLLAELVENSSADQIDAQEYQIEVMRTQRLHLQQDHDLELRRYDALLADIDRKITETQQLIAALMVWEQSQSTDTEDAVSDEESTGRPTNLTLEQLKQQENTLKTDKQAQQNQKSSAETSYKQKIKEIDDTLYIRELRLNSMKEEYKKRQLYAGIDGTVTYVRETPNGFRTTKGALFITISDMSSTAFTVKGDAVSHFTPGEETTIIKGKAEYQAIVTSPAELNMPEKNENDEPILYFRLKTPDPSLESGDAARVEYVLDSRKDVLYIDIKALRTSNDGYFVYVIDENGLRTMKEVTIGLETNYYVEITSGLQEGEKIILK